MAEKTGVVDPEQAVGMPVISGSEPNPQCGQCGKIGAFGAKFCDNCGGSLVM